MAAIYHRAMAPSRRLGPRSSDPLRLEVFHHLFAAAAEEMGAALQRSAFSPNIKERRDFSCALFDRRGRMLSQAAHIPVHLGSLPLCVAACLEELELGPLDTAVLNDPFRGGTHLPDITLVTPVFLPGRRRPDFYCANRAHHADVGGASPGSMAPAADVHGEGLRIPPTRLVQGGRLDRGVLALLLANMRVPREREGDLLAQWAANRLGVRRLTALAAEHGRTALERRGAELLDWAEDLTAAFIGSLPRGRSSSFEDVIEHPGSAGGGRARLRLRLRVHPRGERITFDLCASDDQLENGANATRAVTLSAVFYVLRLFLPAHAPTNAGILRRALVLTRPGSLAEARYPAPVAAGNVETSQRLVDLLLGALAELVPRSAPAASSGTMSNLTLGGVRPEGMGGTGGREGTEGTGYTYYETLAGGSGGSPAGPGAHALHTHMTNTRNTPIEAFEALYPVRVEALTVRRGSGGAGARPGGDGLVKRLAFLGPTHVAWVADRQREGPWGLSGGGRGARGSARLVRAGGRVEVLPCASATSAAPGDRIELATPGGGGHGRPGGSRKPL
jgi:N-methylhydantoinase B